MEPIHRYDLAEETRFILEESRIVVPGVQALFGFQLIAVFNESFSEKLSGNEQMAHLGAIFCVAIAMILVMSPAALHRLGEPGSVTRKFVRRSSRFLEWAMFFLPVGVVIDFYLISRMITDHSGVSAGLAVFLLLICCGFWYVYPRYVGWRHSRSSH